MPRPLKTLKKKNFMAPFYGWGSTASRLQPLRGGSLLFTIQFVSLLEEKITCLSLGQFKYCIPRFLADNQFE